MNTTRTIRRAKPSTRHSIEALESRIAPATFNSAVALNIPGTGTGGTAGSPASVYSSDIAVAGLAGTVTEVRVTLNNFTHTNPDDVEILLVGPGGQNILLMSDSGGLTDVTNLTFTIADAGATALPDAAALTAGIFKPANNVSGANGGSNDNFPAPAPAPSANATLADAFNGTSGNGTWRLFVVDDAIGDIGTLAGWTLDITTSAVTHATDTALVTSHPDYSETGQNVTFTATVTDTTDNDAATSGTVTFRDGATVLGTIPVNASGIASLVTSALALGNHAITATYNGDANFSVSSAGIGSVVDGPTAALPGDVFANSSLITLPQGTGAVAGAVAGPYASHVKVAGVTGTVADVTVTLTGLSHALPDDVDILLVSPDGTHSIVLMSDAGGTTDVLPGTPVTLTFSDAAASLLPDVGALASGTYRPTNHPGNADTFPAPAPAPSGNTSLASTFSGLNPNGVWRLYIVDDGGGDIGQIAGGWSLDFALNTGFSDLAVSKENIGNDDTVSPGEVVSYTINYENAGTLTDTGVKLRDTVPTGATFNAGASTPGWVEVMPGIWELAIGSLGAGASGSAVFAVTLGALLDPAVTADIENTASIFNDGTNADVSPFNNSATDSDTVLKIFPGAKKATFRDVDGDLVTVKITVGTLEDANFRIAGRVFNSLDLTNTGADAASFAGTKVTVSGKPVGGEGDGLVNLGYLNASGIDLNKVAVKGDLGRVDAGDANHATLGVLGLAVQSMGRFGFDTQGSLPGANLQSLIAGGFGPVSVRGDVLGVQLLASSAPGAALGKISVLGSIEDSTFQISGNVAALNVSGSIEVSQISVFGSVGAIEAGNTPGTFKLKGGVAVRGSVTDSVIFVHDDTAAFKVGVNFVNSTFTGEGTFNPPDDLAARTVGAIVIGGRVEDSRILVGFNGVGTGVNPDVTVGKVAVGNEWIASSLSVGIAPGGDGRFGTADDVPIAGGNATIANIASLSIKGHAMRHLDSIDADGIVAQQISKVKIGNSKPVIVPGPNGVATIALSSFSSIVDAGAPAVLPTILPGGKVATFSDVDGDTVTVKVSLGALDASDFTLVPMTGAVAGSARLAMLNFADDGVEFAGAKVSITAKPGPLGGDGLVDVGFLNAAGIDLLAVTVNGDLGRVVAGDANSATNAIGALTVRSMGIFGLATQPTIAGATLDTHLTGGMQKFKSAGDLVDVDIYAGVIAGPAADIAKMTVGGSVRGAEINPDGKLGSLSVSGDLDNAIILTGGSIGTILNGAQPGKFKYTGGLSVKGSVSFSDIRSGGDLSKLTVSGSVISSTLYVLGDAIGTTDALAAQTVGAMTIKGRVENSFVGIGYNDSGNVVNGDVQVLKLSVGTDWITSSFRVGVDRFSESLTPGGELSPITARIASVVVRGHSFATSIGERAAVFASQYGFAAEEIVKFKNGNAAAILAPGPSNDLTPRNLGITFNTTMQEVGLAAFA